MSSDLAILPMMRGAGGGGGGSAKNIPDNLRSTDTFEAIVGLGSSRMVLAPGGLQNLFLDNVPVEDGNGNPNFSEFQAVLFDGDPTILNPVNLSLGQSSGPVTVGLNITNKNSNGPGEWVTGAVTQPGANFIDIRFVVQALYTSTKNGTTSNTASLEIQMRPAGATTWVNPLAGEPAPVYTGDGLLSEILGAILYPSRSYWNADGTGWANPNDYLAITGKTTSAYIKELRIAVPNTGAYKNKTWQVRARLREIDYVLYGSDNQNEDRRTIQFESVTSVNTADIGGTEEWRGLSYVKVYGKATDQLTGVPDITGIYDIGRHLVPPESVWNPLTRLYTGATWDGATTVSSWTQCPAWQIKGLIEDDLSGLSALTPGSTLNKWDALEASKWFSTNVPDGNGGWHPRYSANWFIEEGMQAHELVNYLAGAVGGFAWDEGDGTWRLKVEKPENPVQIFTTENITGEFGYSHTDFDTRYNDIIGVFRNRDIQYQEDRVRVFDQDDIDNTGRRHTTLTLVGCDNRQEALRRVKIRQLVGLNEFRIVTFQTNRQATVLDPFSVIAVADGDLNSDTAIRSTGRIMAINETRDRIVVRDPLRLELGVAYSIMLTVPNPAYNPSITVEPTDIDWRSPTITITRQITNTNAERGDVVNLGLAAALPENLPDYATISLVANGLPALPKQYRVTNLKVDDNNPELVTVTAIEIYTRKWDESDNVDEDQILSQVSHKTVPSPVLPADGIFSLHTSMADSGLQRTLTISWERPASLFIKGYRVEYQLNDGAWLSLGSTTERFVEMANPAFGLYRVRIYTLDRRNLESLPLQGEYLLEDTGAVSPPVGYLTADSVVLAADYNGTVSDWAPAQGTFIVQTAYQRVATDVTYEVVSTTGGLVVSINQNNGVYVPTQMTEDQGSATFRATWNGLTIERTLTIAKARRGLQGTDAPPGSQSSVIYAYQRSVGTPPKPGQQTTYDFSTHTLTGLDNGWTSNIPDGSDQIWIIAASASALTTSNLDTIAANEWSDPVRWSSNSINSATLYLFQRTNDSTPPSLPSQAVTYSFESGALTGVNNGWETTLPPAGGGFRWMTMATVLSTESSDVIQPGEWATAALLAQDGGNNATVYIFATSDTEAPPTLPSQVATYNFTTGECSGLNNGWTNTLPTGGNYRWFTVAKASSPTNFDTIEPSEWYTPGLIGMSGSAGPSGQDAVTILMTRESATLFAYANGGVANFAPASGKLTVWAGQSDVTSQCQMWCYASNGIGATFDLSGNWSVTSMSGDNETLTFRIIYKGVEYQKIFTVTKAKAGYEIVDSLPSNDLFVGRMVFLTADQKLYRFTNSGWSRAVDGADIMANTVDANVLRAGSITAGLLSSGLLITASSQIGDATINSAKIVDLEVDTIKIRDGAVTDVGQFYNGSTYSGNYGYQEIITAQITTRYAGDIIALCSIRQGFANGNRTWNSRILIDGVVVSTVAGTVINDSISMSGKLAVGAGVHTVSVQWLGQPTMTVDPNSASLVTLRRYK